MKFCTLPDCVCGHAHCNEQGGSHYFGDKTMKSPCMATDCECQQYRSSLNYEETLKHVNQRLLEAR